MEVVFKIPEEGLDYAAASDYVLKQIQAIIGQAIKSKDNLIFIRTNLRRGLPLENINKVAGPFVEAWAFEKFELVFEDSNNAFELINVEAGKKLDLYDMILQFRRRRDPLEYTSANIDVKATAQDIPTAGKAPNITSYARIRNEYLDDPDYIFIILSLKHKVYGERDPATGMTNGIMEVTSYSAYNLKYISNADISYNPALGTGQIQIRDIHYVTLERRTTWEFVQMLDKKYIKSKGEEVWLAMARKHEWIKLDK